MTLTLAVVAGGGIAGMAAAAALAPFSDGVLVIERDRLDGQPASRRGVPQSGQLHNLLARAQIHLEELLPGFLDGLRAAGAAEANVSTDTHVFELGHRMPERSVGLSLISVSRPVIDHVLSERLRVLYPNVRIVDGSTVSGVAVDEHHRVVGADVSTEAETTRIEADIVVDCSGVGASGSRWLTDLGVALPTVEDLDVGQWYATCRFAMPDDFTDLCRFWMVFPTPPNPRGALLSPAGSRTWYASVSGKRQDERPHTAEELTDYALGLEDPIIGELLRCATPIDEPRIFMKATATWRHYETWSDPLSGFMPVGDAFASLNPLYGQGVSVAAWEASELRNAVSKGLAEGGGIDAITSSYLRAAGECVSRAWELGALVMADTSDASLTAMKELAAGVMKDDDLHGLYVRLWHLLEPSDRFDQPDVVARMRDVTA